jgi:hypothetical protein
MLASLLILSNLCNYSRPHAPTVGNTEMISCAITAPDSFRCQPFWKTDAHLHADTYSPQKWAEPVPPGLSQKLYLSGQRSKTRLSIERKGLRPSAIPFWDTMPRRVPDGTPIRVISGVPPPSPSEARDRAAPRRPSSQRPGARPDRRASSRRTRCGRGAGPRPRCSSCSAGAVAHAGRARFTGMLETRTWVN